MTVRYALFLIAFIADGCRRHVDEVLSTVGQMLMRRAGAEDVACRYGGDRFVRVFPGST
jgi:PleD family two-component response regulator